MLISAEAWKWPVHLNQVFCSGEPPKTSRTGISRSSMDKQRRGLELTALWFRFCLESTHKISSLSGKPKKSDTETETTFGTSRLDYKMGVYKAPWDIIEADMCCSKATTQRRWQAPDVRAGMCLVNCSTEAWEDADSQLLYSGGNPVTCCIWEVLFMITVQ